MRLWLAGVLVFDEPLSWRSFERELRAAILFPVTPGKLEVRVEVGDRPRHPEVIERWKTSLIFGGAAKKDLAAVATEHRSLTYNITNDLDLPLRRLILDIVAKANPQFLEALGRAMTPQRIQAGLNLLDYLTRTMFSDPAQRRTEQLLLAMKQDSGLGVAVAQELAKDSIFFHIAAQEIAQTIATNMAAIYSGAPDANARPGHPVRWQPQPRDADPTNTHAPSSPRQPPSGTRLAKQCGIHYSIGATDGRRAAVAFPRGRQAGCQFWRSTSGGTHATRGEQQGAIGGL